jgi:hypothetical protein
MDFFKSVLSLLGVPHGPHRPRPIALESSALSKLPPELIFHIVHFLPPDAASSFSLCCRPIYFTLGTQYLKALEENKQLDRYKFLTLLERELDNHVACYYCKKLHAIKKAKRYAAYATGRRRHLPLTVEDGSSYYIHDRFSFTVFQMAMKVYRQGLDCSKLFKLLSYRTTTLVWHGPRGYVEQRMALARIVAGSLLMRQQLIFIIPPSRSIPVPWVPYFTICPHFLFPAEDHIDRYREHTIQVEHWDASKDFPKWEGMMQCRYCLTEFRIDFKKCGRHCTAMFVTRWMDLGEGRSPLDPRWASHVRVDGRTSQVPVNFERGSICAAFEQQEYSRFEFDSLLTPQDWKRLLRKIPSETRSSLPEYHL